MLALNAQAWPINADPCSCKRVGSQDETEIPLCAIYPCRTQLTLLQPTFGSTVVSACCKETGYCIR